MKGFILLLGVLTTSGVEPRPDILNVHYSSLAQCEEARNHPAVQGSYAALFPDHQVLLWCAEVDSRSNKSSHRIME